MVHLKTVILVLAFLHGWKEGSGVNGQGSTPAKVTQPVVESALGKEAKLHCSILDEDVAQAKLRYCVWERVNGDRTVPTFILNFNEITSQPGLYSGMPGYSYSGQGFREGDCGVKISSVSKEDVSKWQCTLIADDKVYRGYVQLEKLELPPPEPKEAPRNVTGVAVASSRISLDLEDIKGPDSERNFDNRPRPIITSYNDARAIIQPEIVVHSLGSDGTPQLIQEVKVESAGLQIKPRRGKLIVFE